MKVIIRKNGVKYSIRESRDRVFLPSEWERFFDNLKDKQKPTFFILINTGARIMEARGIRVRDISFKDKMIKLNKVKRMTNYSDGNKRKVIISNKFSKYLKRIIKEYNLKQDDYLPILSTPAANIGMKKALMKSKIKNYEDFSVHNVRKTIESWLVALDVSQLKILKQFGHSKAVALEYYINIINSEESEKEKIREIIGNLYFGDGKIDRLNDRISKLERMGGGPST